MTELFLFNSLLFIKNLSLELGFFCCAIIIVFANLISLILTFTKKGYSLKKRLWAIFICLSASLFILGLEGQKGVFPTGFFVCVSVGVLFLFILFLPERKYRVDSKSKKFARFIDNCVKSVDNEYPNTAKSDIAQVPICKVKAEPIEKNLSPEIDFSHAKTILSKLEFYPLKEQDKKTAKDLENAILLAEQNGLNTALKENINDGLGALLKIMSKYAI